VRRHDHAIAEANSHVVGVEQKLSSWEPNRPNGRASGAPSSRGCTAKRTTASAIHAAREGASRSATQRPRFPRPRATDQWLIYITCASFSVRREEELDPGRTHAPSANQPGLPSGVTRLASRSGAGSSHPAAGAVERGSNLPSGHGWSCQVPLRLGTAQRDRPGAAPVPAPRSCRSLPRGRVQRSSPS
jgi:hypothetical protein